MIENLIVFAIVGASALYAGRKYLWKAKAKSGACGSGCSSCDSCAEAPKADGRRVIKIHASR